MEQIEACTKELVRSIQESDEYRQFCAVRDKVKQKPGLREQINHFRWHVYQVQNSRKPLDMYEEQERLCREYEEFRKNPLVDEFLRSELRVCRIIQRIAEEVTGSVDLDTESFAEQIHL